MTTIVKRATKGSPLTFGELDSNFENLNTDKLEKSGGTMTGDLVMGAGKALAGIGAGISNMVVFEASDAAWVIPEGVKRLRYTILGAGGGGATTAAVAGQVGGGGGAGGLAVGFIDVVAGQTTLDVTVGAGGAAVTAGGVSSVEYNAETVSATGGGAGVNIGAGGAGGTGTGGTLNVPGSPGAYGGVKAATSTITGLGADAPMGLGYGGLTATAAAGAVGLPGIGYGSGGSGGQNGSAATIRVGGAGRSGVVIIEF